MPDVPDQEPDPSYPVERPGRVEMGQEELEMLYEQRSQRVRVVAKDLRLLASRYDDVFDRDAVCLISDVTAHLESWARAYDDEHELIRRGGSLASSRMVELRLVPTDQEPTELLSEITAAVSALSTDRGGQHLRSVAARCERFLARKSGGSVLVHLSPGARGSPAVMEIIRTRSQELAS